jgi:hypothetical protein
MSDDEIIEFGSLQPINVARSTMRDGDGNEITCSCGKAAGSAIIGKEAYIAYCAECSPTPKYAAEFVCKPPKIP